MTEYEFPMLQVSTGWYFPELISGKLQFLGQLQRLGVTLW
jgi:hypothetical protein